MRWASYSVLVVALMATACTVEYRYGHGTPHEVYRGGDPYYEDQYCPYYENAPYATAPNSCHASQYKDCCLWEVEERYNRTCQEYWCYFYEDCTWYYERILCE